MTPVGPIEGPLGVLLKDMESRLRELETPTLPHPVFACAASALPAASGFIDAVVRVTDLNILAASDGANWIRQDTGAAI